MRSCPWMSACRREMKLPLHRLGSTSIDVDSGVPFETLWKVYSDVANPVGQFTTYFSHVDPSDILGTVFFPIIFFAVSSLDIYGQPGLSVPVQRLVAIPLFLSNLQFHP